MTETSFLQLHDAELLRIESGQLDISEENWADLGKGTTSFAWTNPYATNVSGELFRIVLKSNKAQQVKDIIRLAERTLPALAYDSKNNRKDISLTFDSRDISLDQSALVVYQNEPNPFSDQTTIGFVLPQDGQVTLSVFDISGRVVYQTDAYFQKGYGQFQISEENINARGVMYYRIQAQDQIATRKMILLD